MDITINHRIFLEDSSVISDFHHLVKAAHVQRQQMEILMVTAQQILDLVTADETKEATIINLLTTQSQSIKDITAQLAEAIAANDQTSMQAALDKLTADGVNMDAAIAAIVPPVTNPTVGGGTDTTGGGIVGGGATSVTGGNVGGSGITISGGGVSGLGAGGPGGGGTTP